ncbi:uncharacterized protein FOMMEDRAFT_160571 [Fomitiporia mediterranea MF3/22]|uniref:uncharacterized protein n=1 Tax=Fomitiporia mediterranea (strain MF3/22) TaxID=694068 RepID=UPI0004408C59|nr:uncharacterized protein FOMMEDRAFT_160571 [Fomitiporia mediterranea MF3/22]EJC99504.1 hypothetical protein FOMMEDRAFT_160571 [Fomitiporia mediterranea MF3/22]
MKSTLPADVSSIVDAQCRGGNLAILLLSYFPKFARSLKRTMLRDSSCLPLVEPIALLSNMERALDGLILRFFVDPDLSSSQCNLAKSSLHSSYNSDCGLAACEP